MRQIGEDVAQDPREVISTKAIGMPDLSNPANASAYSQFTWNKFTEMSHKYCSKGLNLGSASMSETEQSRFKTCLNKYTLAFQLFEQEASVYERATAALERAGGDRFAKLNEYDE